MTRSQIRWATWWLFTILSLFSPRLHAVEWDDPEIVGVHKLPPHATYIPFDKVDTARGSREASPYFLSLDGQWKFHLSQNPASRPRDLF